MSEERKSKLRDCWYYWAPCETGVIALISGTLALLVIRRVFLPPLGSGLILGNWLPSPAPSGWTYVFVIAPLIVLPAAVVTGMLHFACNYLLRGRYPNLCRIVWGFGCQVVAILWVAIV